VTNLQVWQAVLSQPNSGQVESLLRGALKAQARAQDRVLDLTFRQRDEAGQCIGRRSEAVVAKDMNLPPARCEGMGATTPLSHPIRAPRSGLP
jgi:hypothetical protein